MYNAATRHLTTVNYDLIIYDDRLVIARGISWRATPRHLAAHAAEGRRRRRAGLRRRPNEMASGAAGGKRVAEAQAIPIDELLSRDAGNRVVEADELACATLSVGVIMVRLCLVLHSGDRLRYTWLNWSSANGEYARIEQALRQVLGAKLQADRRS